MCSAVVVTLPLHGSRVDVRASRITGYDVILFISIQSSARANEEGTTVNSTQSGMSSQRYLLTTTITIV